MLRFFGAVLTVAFTLAGASGAYAHPHVFIEDRVVFLFAGDKITAIEQSWKFDEVFSDTLIQQFDKNGDGVFDAAESKTVAGGTLPNLKQFRYFNYEWIDGKDIGMVQPINFVAVAKNKIVTFVFTVKLPKPIDPKTQKLKVEINDREFYVEVDLAKDQPILFNGNKGVACTPKVRDDTENAYYGGFVYPQEITLSCH